MVHERISENAVGLPTIAPRSTVVLKQRRVFCCSLVIRMDSVILDVIENCCFHDCSTNNDQLTSTLPISCVLLCVRYKRSEGGVEGRDLRWLPNTTRSSLSTSYDKQQSRKTLSGIAFELRHREEIARELWTRVRGHDAKI